MKAVNRMCPYHENVYVTPPCLIGKKHVTKRLSQIWRRTNWHKKVPFWFPWLYRVSEGSVCRSVKVKFFIIRIMRSQSFSTNGRTAAVSCVKEMSAGGDVFVMGKVSMERRNV